MEMTIWIGRRSGPNSLKRIGRRPGISHTGQHRHPTEAGHRVCSHDYDHDDDYHQQLHHHQLMTHSNCNSKSRPLWTQANSGVAPRPDKQLYETTVSKYSQAISSSGKRLVSHCRNNPSNSSRKWTLMCETSTSGSSES